MPEEEVKPSGSTHLDPVRRCYMAQEHGGRGDPTENADAVKDLPLPPSSTRELQCSSLTNCKTWEVSAARHGRWMRGGSGRLVPGSDGRRHCGDQGLAGTQGWGLLDGWVGVIGRRGSCWHAGIPDPEQPRRIRAGQWDGGATAGPGTKPRRRGVVARRRGGGGGAPRGWEVVAHRRGGGPWGAGG